MTSPAVADEDLAAEIGQRLVPEIEASQIIPAAAVFAAIEAARDDGGSDE